MIRFLFKGFVIGFITGMPLGPIGALCLDNTLNYGRKSGLISGLGSAIADTIFAIIALLGIDTIYRLLISNTLYLHFIGGIVMIFFGIHMFNSQAAASKKNSNYSTSKSSVKIFFSTLILALANPATIFSFIAVFTGSNISLLDKGFESKFLIIIGVFLASMGWWFVIVFLALNLNKHLNNKILPMINKILSVGIILSGVIIFLSTSNLRSMIMPPILHSKLFRLLLHIKTNFHFYKRFR
ncbi:LysE family transporter [Clostridium sp. 19966]|uniref:LysE family translocator n=1 Tax=Clostridium sp. 19966 TaxID=2768166 RepID=UPI0028DF3556|nr:LysE family transporter [Clostridium sp. 19966]MDT8718108.1 LysE family transporter [Clostridium sp. 19966]